MQPALQSTEPAATAARHGAASPPGCAGCALRALCLTRGVAAASLERLDSLVAARRGVPRSGRLFRKGDRLESIFAVRSGFFKTSHAAASGQPDHVCGFHMAGDLLGLEGIDNERHGCDAVALEDSQVCVIPYARLEALCRECGPLQRQFHKIMSREIAGNHELMLLLGGRRAKERLATFLLHLTQRLQSRGQASAAMVLRMTREEIGSHLGLKLQTVSRCFSQLQDDQVLRVRRRHIDILDPGALARLVNG